MCSIEPHGTQPGHGVADQRGDEQKNVEETRRSPLLRDIVQRFRAEPGVAKREGQRSPGQVRASRIPLSDPAENARARERGQIV